MALIDVICPSCKSKIKANDEKSCELCPSCGMLYVVKNAINSSNLEENSHNNVATESDFSTYDYETLVNEDIKNKNGTKVLRDFANFLSTSNDSNNIKRVCLHVIKNLNSLYSDATIDFFELNKDKIKKLNYQNSLNDEINELHKNMIINDVCYAILIGDEKLLYSSYINMFINSYGTNNKTVDKENEMAEYSFVINKVKCLPDILKSRTYLDDFNLWNNKNTNKDNIINPSLISKILKEAKCSYSYTGFYKHAFTNGNIFCLNNIVYCYNYGTRFVGDIKNPADGFLKGCISLFRLKEIRIEYLKHECTISFSGIRYTENCENTLKFINGIKDYNIEMIYCIDNPITKSPRQVEYDKFVQKIK